ncbi:uncharacterized protein PFL1_04071 [Pseudozyma flocculosa PF-1]|uniref:Uncharacterized protein n=2 Tax=Pseudozyma flocculosa TaxID=84751 RepID=A0A5C3ESR5_9BASI|nr:uncharacterized protein PFL1_04071 [Pseudozyma flocculosa PF-1]EPQ28244.1 hypothetical protein PFL1_04071 [Pseudozyma flocculosa PF-1]SPO35383.1 uncharacterized protein PSFLO_00854 [Pseudozyma flocculosa]
MDQDQDPFAVWATPDPLSDKPAASSDATPIALTSSAPDSLRASLDGAIPDDDDDDPGWGTPPAALEPSQQPGKAEHAETGDANGSQPAEQLVTASKPTSDDDEKSAANTREALDDATEAQAQPEEEGQQQQQDPTNLAKDQDAPSEPTPSAPSPPAETPDTPAPADGFDDFDDFDEPAGTTNAAAAADDEFGDFGDFDDGAAADEGQQEAFEDGFNDQSSAEPAPVAAATPSAQSAAPVRSWSALPVSRDSSRDDLFAPVQDLLPTSTAAAQHMATDGLRQVEGLAQVLVSEPSRQLWKDLSALPPIKPIDWIRSRTRRDYLITMGVPVNLDEIHNSSHGPLSASSSSSGSRLPPLQLKFDSSRSAGPSSALSSDGVGSAGLQRSSSAQHSPSASLGGPMAGQQQQRSASASGSPRNGTQSPALGQSNNRERLAERRREELGLGPPPDVDLKRAEELVGKTEDDLSLLSLPALRSMLRELHSLTTSTSSLLTHHLTIRESHQADSEMYNSMIKELVTGAASRIGGGGGGGGAGVSRSGSLRGGAASSSSSSAGSGADRRATTIGIGANAIAKNRAAMAGGGSRLSGQAGGFVNPSGLRGGRAG